MEPQFGGITFSSVNRELGSTANYSCNSPAVLMGERVRTCLVTGDWSGEAPACEREGGRDGREGGSVGGWECGWVVGWVDDECSDKRRARGKEREIH